MAKDREIICKYYSYKDGPCDKRGISVSMREECQTCKYYEPRKGGRPARPNKKKEKLEKIRSKDIWY